MPKRFLLVVDAEILAQIVAITGPLACRVMDPVKAAGKPRQTSVETILVFTLDGEWKLTRLLARENPKCRVVSAQYHFAPVSLNKPVRLPVVAETADYNEQGNRPVVMISTPGSDAEYVAKLMAENGLSEPREYLGKPFLTILKHLNRFMPLKYVRMTERLNQAAILGEGNRRLALLIQSDIITELSKTNSLSNRRLFWLLEKSGAKVIFVCRRDKLSRAGIVALMENRPLRSIWTMAVAQRKNFPGKQKLPTLMAMEKIEELGAAEAVLAKALKDLPHSHTVFLEDIVSRPEETLKSIARFIGEELPQDLEKIPYAAEYGPNTQLGALLVEFKQEMIDRLGLHSI